MPRRGIKKPGNEKAKKPRERLKGDEKGGPSNGKERRAFTSCQKRRIGRRNDQEKKAVNPLATLKLMRKNRGRCKQVKLMHAEGLQTWKRRKTLRSNQKARRTSASASTQVWKYF